MKVPLCVPYIGNDELDAVRKVLESGWLTDGPRTIEFENAFAEYVGVKRAVAVNSCTSALFLSILASGIKGEVIVPSFTFVASANAIVTAGAKPVFADINYETCNIDVEKLKGLISERTEAIMPVHFAGQSCDMRAVMELAEEHGLKVIEDSAETIGGSFDGRMTGSFGLGCFSFYPTKNMATGDGGMVTVQDDDLADRIAMLKAHGILKGAFERERQERPWFRSALEAGYNFRMPDILSAIGLVQLGKVDRMNEMRRKHAKYLNENLPTGHLDLPYEEKSCRHVYQMYTVKVKGLSRDRFVSELRKEGIGASVHFDPPVHLQPLYKNIRGGRLDVTERVSGSIVTLPMYPGLNAEELDFIVGSVKKVVQRLS